MEGTIYVPDSIAKELAQQFYADEHYDGFNKETLLCEMLKEVFNMEIGILRVE